MKSALSGCAMSVISPVSAGGFIDGNSLATYCAAGENECAAYVTGVADLLGNRAMPVQLAYCPPFGTTVRTLVDAFQAFAAERAELLSASAANVVAIALSIKFPCQPGT